MSAGDPAGLRRTLTPMPGQHDSRIAYDLLFIVSHQRARIRMTLKYNVELYRPEGAARLLDAYAATIERCTRQ
jgi:hypothetical protein